jgi:hypothetical protein
MKFQPRNRPKGARIERGNAANAIVSADRRGSGLFREPTAMFKAVSGAHLPMHAMTMMEVRIRRETTCLHNRRAGVGLQCGQDQQQCEERAEKAKGRGHGALIARS